MVELDPCKRLSTIKEQLLKDIIGEADPSEEEEFGRMIEQVLPDLEIKALELAARCREHGGSEELCDEAGIRKLFEDAYRELEKKYAECESG